MSTLALGSAVAVSPAIESKPRPSLFQRLIEAREKEATRRVHAFLVTLSDERLHDLGYSPDDIAALRDGQFRMPR